MKMIKALATRKTAAGIFRAGSVYQVRPETDAGHKAMMALGPLIDQGLACELTGEEARAARVASVRMSFQGPAPAAPAPAPAPELPAGDPPEAPAEEAPQGAPEGSRKTRGR